MIFQYLKARWMFGLTACENFPNFCLWNPEAKKVHTSPYPVRSCKSFKDIVTAVGFWLTHHLQTDLKNFPEREKQSKKST